LQRFFVDVKVFSLRSSHEESEEKVQAKSALGLWVGKRKGRDSSDERLNRGVGLKANAASGRIE
jgi:hypothetical protein